MGQRRFQNNGLDGVLVVPSGPGHGFHDARYIAPGKIAVFEDDDPRLETVPFHKYDPDTGASTLQEVDGNGKAVQTPEILKRQADEKAEAARLESREEFQVQVDDEQPPTPPPVSSPSAGAEDASKDSTDGSAVDKEASA